LDGNPAFMDVQDDTAGEEGMDYTGPSAIPSIGIGYMFHGMPYKAMTITSSVCFRTVREIGGHYNPKR